MDGAERIRTPFGAFLRSVGDDLADAASGSAGSSAPHDRSTWRQLLKPVIPRNGESLRGLVARACQNNHLPNSYGVLQHLGLVHRNRVLVAEDVSIDPAELAFAIRVDEDEVRIRRYDPVGPGKVSFFGFGINHRRIDTRTRMFSPAAFHGDDSGLPHYHRAIWELSDIPFCLEGWDMLQDRCGCETGGVVQRWTRTTTRIEECDKCGDPLAWIDPILVPERMRPSLGILTALLPERLVAGLDVGAVLPEPLRTIDRGLVLNTVLALARAIDPSSSGHSFEDPEARLGALHAACAAVIHWPHGLTDVNLDPGVSPITAERLCVAWHGLAPLARRGEKTRSRPAAVACSNGAFALKPIGIRPATEMARLSPEVLTAAWEHGLVTKHRRVHGTRLLPAYDPGELTVLGDEWRARHEPSALAYELGLPLYGIEQLAALGTLIADAVAIPGTGPHFTPAQIEAFLLALADAQRPVGNPVPLRQLMRRVGGRLKAWGPVIAALLCGNVPFTLLGAGRLVDCISVPETCFGVLGALRFDRCEGINFSFSKTMVQRDALELLNAPLDNAKILDGLKTTGANPKLYRVDEVVQRSREIVALPEVAAILGMDPASAYEDVVRRGLWDKVVYKGAWPRDLLPELCRTP